MRVPKNNKFSQKYRESIFKKSMAQVVFTLSIVSASYVFGVYVASVNYYYSILLAIPAALFTVRAFILQHDCGHRSLFSSSSANKWLGRILGVVTLTPFACWKRFHAMHHASSGNLDKRGVGDIITLTVEEYSARSAWSKFGYRIYRHPVTLFIIGPSVLFFIRQRFAYYLPKSWKKERRSVYQNNLVLVAIVALLWWFDILLPSLLFWGTVMCIAATIGVWLFYVQHQFPNAYWRKTEDWCYQASAIEGSTFYDLPDFLHWLTAYIGFHHIHHLDCNIPNYRLKECYVENESVQNPIKLSFLESIDCAKLKLWDEKKGMMVGFTAAIEGA